VKLEKLKSKYFKPVKLTKTEYKVLKLLVEGKSNVEIASELIISPHTAKAHVSNIIYKLQVENRIQAAVKAVREKLVEGVLAS